MTKKRFYGLITVGAIGLITYLSGTLPKSSPTTFSGGLPTPKAVPTLSIIPETPIPFRTDEIQPTISALEDFQPVQGKELTQLADGSLILDGPSKTGSLILTEDQLLVDPSSPQRFLTIRTRKYVDLQAVVTFGNIQRRINGRLTGIGVFHGEIIDLDFHNGQKIKEERDITCPLFLQTNIPATGPTPPGQKFEIFVDFQNSPNPESMTIIEPFASTPPNFNGFGASLFDPSCPNGLIPTN